MTLKPIRVYADTSVYGGTFDKEFARFSRLFFEQVRAGHFELITSAVVEQEIGSAPEKVRRYYESLTGVVKTVGLSPEALHLRSRYLAANIVGAASEADALHVALATVTLCSVIVSWNFKHIVHFQKIPLYNAINVVTGYGTLTICTPAEVVMP